MLAHSEEGGDYNSESGEEDLDLLEYFGAL